MGNIQVFYIGPIGKPNYNQRGGFEAANRKNINKLVQKGILVEELPYPYIKTSSIIGKLKYFKLLFLSCKLLFRRRIYKKQIVHLTPLYKHFIYFEYVILRICSLLGYKTVLDIRAGSFIYYYNQKSNLYKYFIRKALKVSTMITVESKSYIAFLDQFALNKVIHYFPNTAIINNQYRSKTSLTPINLIYFGRISKTKGFNTILELIEMLGPSYKLYLAGKFEEEIDRNKLNSINITYLGLLDQQELNQIMASMHFFIFPTKHRGEGQSNSLIEAMSHGIIPICSDNGFNREVVADNGHILEINATSLEYYESIRRIIETNQLESLSLKCYEHILNFHNTDKEIDKIISLYNECLCR